MKNLLTLEAFADWAEKKPADEVFDITSPWSCAVAQYAHSLGFTGATCEFEINAGDERVIAIAKLTPELMWSGPEKGVDRTFGALASRLRTASQS